MNHNPNFDFCLKRGQIGEAFAEMAMGDSVKCETKTDSWYVHSERFYIEYECQGRDGKWRPSGIDHPQAEAQIWNLKWGKHPAVLSIETEWLRRAFLLAKSDPDNHGSHTSKWDASKGIFVYLWHILQTRDRTLDEH